MDASLIYKIACWSNAIALIIFLGIEIFWFVEESKKFKEALPLAVAFVLYNLPFFLLGLSLYFQPIPTGWIGVLRLVFLLVCIPINLWLHFHGDNGGNSVGMIIVVFLLFAVPFVVIMEVLSGSIITANEIAFRFFSTHSRTRGKVAHHFAERNGGNRIGLKLRIKRFGV
jgi:hypothetical protein